MDNWIIGSNNWVLNTPHEGLANSWGELLSKAELYKLLQEPPPSHNANYACALLCHFHTRLGNFVILGR